MFPSCAQFVFTGAQWFLKSFPSSQCVPQDVPNSHHTLSHCLGPKLSFHNLQRWPKGKHLHTSIWGVCNVSNLFFVLFFRWSANQNSSSQTIKNNIKKLVALPWNNFFWLMKIIFLAHEFVFHGAICGRFTPQQEVIVEFINFMKPPNHQYVPKLNTFLICHFCTENHPRKQMTL